MKRIVMPDHLGIDREHPASANTLHHVRAIVEAGDIHTTQSGPTSTVERISSMGSAYTQPAAGAAK